MRRVSDQVCRGVRCALQAALQVKSEAVGKKARDEQLVAS